MFTIHLDKLEFFAHHGLHDEEAVTGTRFEVSADINFNPVSPIKKIDQTIDYSNIYSIIEKHMLEPVALLETLAENIVEEIHATDNRVKNIRLRIMKLHPPIKRFTGQAGVTLSRDFL